MLLPKTVFILGAAVSHEVGFSLGGDFKDDIRHALGDASMSESVRFALNSHGDTIWAATRRLISALPAHASIDNLIESNAADAMIVAAGKIGIAAAILDHERKGPICAGPGKPATLLMDNIYGDLFLLITQGCRREHLAEAFSRLAIVNFNYDRSLQQFMTRALSEFIGFSMMESLAIVSRMAIHHAYGSLGQLGEEGSPAYGADLGPDALARIAGTIRTFSEGAESATRTYIGETIRGADRLIFLGCAHHRQNMSLLKPSGLKAQSAYGTIYFPPPADPRNYAVPSMDEFLQPTIGAFKRALITWNDPLTWSDANNPNRNNDPLHVDGCHIEACTSRQLLARYRSVWTDLSAPADPDAEFVPLSILRLEEARG